MIGFLHGFKPLVETLRNRDTTTGTDWTSTRDQINDMLGRLEPHRIKKMLAWLGLIKRPNEG
jgi:hypothetical protein